MTKIALVTGASRGIGAATAILLARQGYQVCINYQHNKQRAVEVLQKIESQQGDAFICQADVTNETDVISLFETIEARFGTVTHLVNNAGILSNQSRLVDMSLERFNHVLLTNITSCFLCSKQFLLRNNAGGAIVNVSSAAARTGSPFEYIDYAASKGAMDTLTKGLSLEVAERGIRVNAVRPGFIHTEMHRDGGEPDRVARLAPLIPMKRGGTADEVAQAIAWLLSDAASYVTGSFIDLAGGR